MVLQSYLSLYHSTFLLSQFTARGMHSWPGCITTEQQDFLKQQNRAALANNILSATVPLLIIP